MFWCSLLIYLFLLKFKLGTTAICLTKAYFLCPFYSLDHWVRRGCRRRTQNPTPSSATWWEHLWMCRWEHGGWNHCQCQAVHHPRWALHGKTVYRGTIFMTFCLGYFVLLLTVQQSRLLGRFADDVGEMGQYFINNNI